MDKTISRIIDFLRFPMACAVVLLHIPGKYTNWSNYTFKDLKYFSLYDHISLTSNIICQIAVPIFFLISGYLFYDKDKNTYQQKLYKRTKTILVPYFIWNGIAFLQLLFIKILGIYINHKSTSGLIEYVAPLNIIKYFIGNFNNQFTWQPINAPLWVIRDLYIMFLFYPIIYYVLKYTKFIGIGILSIFYILNLYGLPCLQIQTLYFFSIGIYIRMYNINILKNIKNHKTIILGIAIISFILRYLTGNRIFMPTFIITFTAITIDIILHLQTKRSFTYIQNLKKYSFFIFATHIIIIERLGFLLYHPFFSKIDWLHCFSYIINPIIIITICSFLYKLLEKTCPRFLSIITGAR